MVVTALSALVIILAAYDCSKALASKRYLSAINFALFIVGFSYLCWLTDNPWVRMAAFVASWHFTMHPDGAIDHATEFTYSDKPLDAVFRPRETIKVQWRGDKQWAITNGLNDVYNREGFWEREPRPSARTEDFKKRARWTLYEALRTAPTLVGKEFNFKDYPTEDDE